MNPKKVNSSSTVLVTAFWAVRTIAGGVVVTNIVKVVSSKSQGAVENRSNCMYWLNTKLLISVLSVEVKGMRDI